MSWQLHAYPRLRRPHYEVYHVLRRGQQVGRQVRETSPQTAVVFPHGTGVRDGVSLEPTEGGVKISPAN